MDLFVTNFLHRKLIMTSHYGEFICEISNACIRDGNWKMLVEKLKKSFLLEIFPECPFVSLTKPFSFQANFTLDRRFSSLHQ